MRTTFLLALAILPAYSVTGSMPVSPANASQDHILVAEQVPPPPPLPPASAEEDATPPPPPAPATPEGASKTPIKPKKQDRDHLEPEVTIVPKGEVTHEEYRVNGVLYMIRVVPKRGKPYYLIDHRGEGVFERSDLEPQFSVPMWLIKRF